MNSIAPKIAGLLVFGYWHSPRETNMTPNFVDAARLPTFFGTRIHLGIIFGIVLLILFGFVMKKTRWGLELRTIGGNIQAARRNGIPVAKYMILVFSISGGIAGLAGMAQVSGFYGLLIPNFSPGYGYMGFLISWLAGGDPFGILLMSFVVSVILTGGNMLQVTIGLPYAVINLLLAFTLFVVLAKPVLFNFRKGKTI
jgi:simple sugar transport system permease protein